MPTAVAPLRARCPSCRFRFAWPAGVYQGEPERQAPWAACPECHLVARLTPEPPDERWWRYTQAVTA